jgi:hypothetical protein
MEMGAIGERGERMGMTIALQELTTLRGKVPTVTAMGILNQPSTGWVETEQHTDVAVATRILRFLEPVAPGLKLRIQSAASPAGPWWDLAVYEDPLAAVTPFDDEFSASTRAGTGDTFKLGRLLRWQIDPSALSAAEVWALCFQICVTLK